MSKHPFQAGDMVRIVSDPADDLGLSLHSVHPVYRVDEDLDVYLMGSDRDDYFFFNHEVEPVESAPSTTPHTGTEERLMIEAMPKGGYKITKPDSFIHREAGDIAAFSTLAEATAFIGRELRV